jgi:hypothetical protein
MQYSTINDCFLDSWSQLCGEHMGSWKLCPGWSFCCVLNWWLIAIAWTEFNLQHWQTWYFENEQATTKNLTNILQHGPLFQSKTISTHANCHRNIGDKISLAYTRVEVQVYKYGMIGPRFSIFDCQLSEILFPYCIIIPHHSLLPPSTVV